MRICDYSRDIPDNTDDWLWGNGSAFYKLGGWEGFAAEQNEIILDTLKRYPLMHVTSATADVVSQFISFRTGISTTDNAPTIGALAAHAPQLMPQLTAARQQNGQLDVEPLNWLHLPLAGLSILGLGLALIWRRRLNIAPEIAALCLSTLLALAANAAICGLFSHPADRYQSRLVPLAPFAMALLIARRR